MHLPTRSILSATTSCTCLPYITTRFFYARLNGKKELHQKPIAGHSRSGVHALIWNCYLCAGISNNKPASSMASSRSAKPVICGTLLHFISFQSLQTARYWP